MARLVVPFQVFSSLAGRLWEHRSLEDCTPLRMSDAREEK